MIERRNRILVILSDIDFSPQLVVILKVLQDRGANVRIIEPANLVEQLLDLVDGVLS